MKIKIKYLDGKRFRRSIIASLQNLIGAEKHLNEINVFPVPDGDTGTNMVATMRSVAEGAETCREHTIEGVSHAIADSALNGSRGNSGAILAQFFQGLAEATQGKVRLSTRAFAQAVSEAADKARQAMASPREGTIITVMREWANAVAEHAHSTQDFSELFRQSLNRARQSLAETPARLKELKLAGVVDAGAEGFVKILEGVADFIARGRIAAHKAGSLVQDRMHGHHLARAQKNFTFRYCTECLIEGKDLDREQLRRQMMGQGDSLLVVGSISKMRLHIHTNQPESVFEIAERAGRVLHKKVDDMLGQHEEAVASGRIALVTDSTCDLPEELIKKFGVTVVPVWVQVGERSYRDREEITADDFFNHLKSGQKKLFTSQPTPGQFKDSYNTLTSAFNKILSVHISSKLSGTLQGAMAGRQLAEQSDKIQVFDSKTSSAGLGLLVMQAARWIEEGLDVETIESNLKQAIAQLRVFVNLPTLKYVMRSGRLSKPKGFLATVLNLKPVLTLSPQGELVEAAKVVGKKRGYRKTLDLALRAAQKFRNPLFNIAHARADELVAWYEKRIRQVYADAEIFICSASPALTLHIGQGGSAIAVSGDLRS